jgi:hypothetical protein
LFTPQLQNLADECGVIPRRIAEFSGAGGVDVIQRFAQIAVVRILHDREIGRHLQREFPARLAGLRRLRLVRRFEHVIRHAG